MAIFLRKLIHTDIDKLVRMADNTAIANDMCTLPSPFLESDALAIINRSEGDTELISGIIEKETNQLSGLVMLRDFDPCHEIAELSIWIGQEYWGKGYGTIAIIQICEIGFLEKKLNRIYAYCMVRNLASQRILEKTGFSREGLLRERVIINGIYEDVYLYAMLKKDYKSQLSFH